ncbi:MAG TPA: PadR family transcriptional regulator [Acidimicrobiia bacterium]
MEPSRLSTTEFAVLGLMAEAPTHGFAVSKQLSPHGELGRVFTVQRPLVYRALDRLVDLGLMEPVKTEPGDAGPQRVVHRVTPIGLKRLEEWLEEPVEHVRDIRIGFLLRLTLLQRSGQSPLALIRAQRAALGSTLAALEAASGDTTDPVELWRRHNGAATGSYLEQLERIHDG